MLLTALLLIAVVWVGIVALVVAVCVSAARGDRVRTALPPAPARAERLRLIA